MNQELINTNEISSNFEGVAVDIHEMAINIFLILKDTENKNIDDVLKTKYLFQEAEVLLSTTNFNLGSSDTCTLWIILVFILY